MGWMWRGQGLPLVEAAARSAAENGDGRGSGSCRQDGKDDAG